MPSDDDKSRIEDLRKSLYSKSNPPPAIVKRRRMHERPHLVNESWGNVSEIDNNNDEEEPVYKSQYGSLFKWLLIFAVIFFVASAGVAGYVYYRGSNVVSPNNISISVIGPVSIAAGQTLTLDVDITNKNNAGLELADLSLDYPDGTKSAVNLDLPLKTDQISIDALASGQTIRKSSKSILYGPENSKENVKVTLTYRIPGSNAVFTKVADYNVLIASAPVSLAIDSLKEINSGQELTINAHIVSNAAIDLHNILFNVTYPFGFSFESASPTPAFANNIFNLGNFVPGESRDITIIGKVTGQDGEERIFHFYTGTASSSDQKSIDTVFINTSQTIAIKKPFLETHLVLERDPSSVKAITTGEVVHGEIDYQNNLTTPITDASIRLDINGDILDKSSVNSDTGFYSSNNNTINWTSNDVSDLKTIAPGDRGAVYFTFSTLPVSYDVNRTYRNPIINLSGSVFAKRFSDSNVPESISSGASSTAKVSSNLALTSSVVHSTGPFTNTGFIPPKADQPTTYTVNWAITNSFNQVDNAVVTANLPPYVKWLNIKVPSTENISFNPNTNQISWVVGRVDAGIGFVNSPRTLSFQISFTPSVSQVGTSPDLLENIAINGSDNFTGVALKNQNPALTTRLINDPNFHYGDDQVSR